MGKGAQGPPSHRPYMKPVALPCRSHPCPTTLAGAAGLPRQGLRGMSGLDKRSRKERGAVRQLLGRRRMPGCRERDALACRTKLPLCEPWPSTPR